MLETLVPGVVAGLVAGLVTWGGLRVEMRYMRIIIEAAHDRLDKIGAPAARTRLGS